MRLEFEPNVTALPLIENELFDDFSGFELSDSAELLKKGISAAQTGDREFARTLLLRATEIDPGSEDAWMWLASISEYPEELLAFLNNVLDINPVNQRAVEWHVATRSLLAKTFVGRGISAHEEGTDELALRCLDQALDYDQECELAWFWKASIADSVDERAQYLERVLSINPENDDARSALRAITTSKSQSAILEAKAAALAGKRKRAVEILDEVLRKDPENAEAWILRSHVSLDFDEKLHALDMALAIEPENLSARSGHDFLTSMIAEANPQETKAVLEPIVSGADAVTAGGSDLPGADDAIAQVEVVEIPESSEFVSNPEPVEESHEAVELFGTIDGFADADLDTVESIHMLSADETGKNVTLAIEADDAASDPVYVIEETGDIICEVLPSEDPDKCIDESASSELVTSIETSEFTCPYCSAENGSQAFECDTCHATLILSDIETLLSNSHVDRDLIQQSVTEMEAAWNLREFSEKELTALSIGHFNLGNYERGFKYLQEASRLDPNNVILSGHVNTIAIRLEEMRRQDEAHNAMPKGKTILVIDDSATVRKLISGKLEKSGHHVICAVDGIDGLARIEEGLPDLILLDITMPRMDGYQVCKQIRSNPAAKDIPIVMISGKDGFFDKVRGRLAGTSGYITKPFGPETLMKAVETYLVYETDPTE